MQMRVLLAGMALWAAGTIGIRLTGQHVLQPGRPGRIVILYLISFVLMALLVRRICRRMVPEKDGWPRAAAILALPTLVLDPFSCLFLPIVFPNLDPAAAGLFGGWMLICCGGALAGVLGWS